MHHWYSLDEVVFQLPIDVDNVPGLVRQSCCQGVEGKLLIKAAEKWRQKPGSKKQWRERLWRFKLFVAERLCEEAAAAVMKAV